jgi:hypothetical protein
MGGKRQQRGQHDEKKRTDESHKEKITKFSEDKASSEEERLKKKRQRVRTITREGNSFKHKVNWCKNMSNCQYRKQGNCICAHTLEEWIAANANARGFVVPSTSSMIIGLFALFIGLCAFLLSSK